MAQAAPDERRKWIVEIVFRTLTDVNPEGVAIRRQCAFGELCAITRTAPDELRQILDAFRAPSASFLTPYAPAPIDEKTPIDISHEALIRCWRKIGPSENAWLRKEFRDGLSWRTFLFQAENIRVTREHVTRKGYARFWELPEVRFLRIRLFNANDRPSYLSEAAAEYGARRLSELNEAWAKRYGGGWPKVETLIKTSREHWERRRRVTLWVSVASAAAIFSMLVVINALLNQKNEQLRDYVAIQNEYIQGLTDTVRGAILSSLPAQERRAILDSVTRSVEKLADMVAGDPKYKVMLITLFNSMSDLSYDAEDWERAEKAAKTAQILAQSLVNKSPLDLNLQRLLYRSTWLLADALAEDKRTDQAEAAYQHALNIATELVRLTNGDLSSNRDVAFIEPKLGDMCLIRKDIDCALAHYRNALAINQRLLSGLAKDDEVKPDVQRDLAANRSRIGDVFFRQKMMLDDALDQYQSAAETDEQLVADHPNELIYQSNLSRVYNQIASVRERQGDLPAAMNLYQKSLNLRGSVARRDPSNNTWLYYVATQYSKLGDLLVKMDGNPDRPAGGGGLGPHTADAITNYKSAENVWDELVTRMPEKIDWMRQSAEVLQKLVRLFLNQSEAVGGAQKQEILNYAETAVALRRRIAQNSPASLQHRELAVAYVSLGDVFKAIGDNAESLKQYQEARSIIDNFTSAHPNDYALQAWNELRQDVCNKDSGVCP
jgi:tetratricopeptide (TPR) repeat protein